MEGVLRFEALDGTNNVHLSALIPMPLVESLAIQCDKSRKFTQDAVILRNLRNLDITERFSIDYGRGSATQVMRDAEMPVPEALRMSLVPTAGPVFPASASYTITTLDISC